MLWDAFICKLCSELSQKVGLMSRLKAKVPQPMLTIIYQTTVQPVIDYCITLCGYAPSTQVNKVQRFQNRAARIVSVSGTGMLAV